MTSAAPDRWPHQPAPADRRSGARVRVTEADAAAITLAPGASVRVNRSLANALSQAAANRERARQLARQTERLLTETLALRQAVTDSQRARLTSPANRDLLRRYEQIRLMARLATMPVIEQAKGIIIAQSHCGEDDAFDMLRRASQRSNVPVRDLAARIVAQAAQHDDNADARPGWRAGRG